MATAPVKSQPLHNFTFPFLKWGNQGAVTDQRSVSPEIDTDSDPPRQPRVGSRSARVQRLAFTSKSIRKHRKQKGEDISAEMEEDAQVEAILPTKPGKRAAGEEKAGNETAEDEEEHEEEETAKRPWNLRPRKSEASVTVTVEKQAENAVAAPKSMRLRGIAENGGGAAEKEKRRFWIALSKDEIEEDIYAMTESRPNRRPRKRPRSVQKQLDNVFPGLWLVGSSADDFRITDSPVKK